MQTQTTYYCFLTFQLESISHTKKTKT